MGFVVLSECGHAEVNIYGAIDLAVGMMELQPPGAPNASITKTSGVQSGILQNSFFGIHGIQDLGGGLFARFQLESFIRADTGATGRFDASPTTGADPMWSREFFVGLGGAFGEIRLGNNTSPLWISMVQTSPMSTNSSFSPIFRQLFNGGTRGKSEIDSALINSVKYNSPVVGDFQFSVALQANEIQGAGSNYSGNLTYRNGPLFISAAMMKVNYTAAPTVVAVRDQAIYLLGAAYDFEVIKPFAQYTTVSNDRLAINDKFRQIGFTVPLGGGSIQFSVGEDRTSGASTGVRTTTSLGYVHALSRRADLYAFAARDKVDVGTAVSYVVGTRQRF